MFATVGETCHDQIQAFQDIFGGYGNARMINSRNSRVVMNARFVNFKENAEITLNGENSPDGDNKLVQYTPPASASDTPAAPATPSAASPGPADATSP